MGTLTFPAGAPVASFSYSARHDDADDDSADDDDHDTRDNRGPASIHRHVAFTWTGTGNIASWFWASWFWNFGDGRTSKKPNPQHTYKKVGGYWVKLTVKGTVCCHDMATANLTILPPQRPVASFSATPGTASLNVTFTSTSTGAITACDWSFGDDRTSTSTQCNPLQHTYEKAGTYKVQLTVTGPGGKDTATSTVIVSKTK